MTEHTRRIVKCEKQLLQATDEQVLLGLTWYSRANSYLRQVALEYGVTTDICAKVCSILSPSSKWERNKTDLCLMLSAKNLPLDHVLALPFATYKKNVKKAYLCLHGLSELTEKSRKTYAFYRNLMLDDNHVTIDRHAITAISAFNPKNGAKSQVRYSSFVKVYESIAKRYCLKPYELQAIVWEVERANKNQRRRRV